MADDYGVPGAPRTEAYALLKKMLTEPIGPIVQLRRWFTLWDAAKGLDQIWHSMLIALVAMLASEGKDAYRLAETVAASS